MSSQPTSHRRNLTQTNNRIRNLHAQRSWRRPTTLNVRGHQLVAENPNNQHHHAYELRNDDEVLGTIELDHFHNADDLVRFINSAIKHDFETAREWAREHFTEWHA